MSVSRRVLIDCDGVLLNWEYAFQTWLAHHGHDPIVIDSGLFYKVADQYGLTEEKVIHLVKAFNESASIGFLPAMRDAVQYVRRLHEENGFIFHVVSSAGDDPLVHDLRTRNLEKLFGASAFEHIECLPLGSSKKEYLIDFVNTGDYWIEDNIQNAEIGLKFGLSPLLMEHGFNMDYKNPDIPLVQNWKQIHSILTY